jgi:hypothetical protein
MKVLAGILFLGLAAGLFAQQPATEEGRSRFRAVDIYLDAKGTPLAAYQLEFTVTNVVAKIVGIEGGDNPAFHDPPFYDPKAIQHERVILAAFSTDAAEKLPSGRTRVATIHLQTFGDAQPKFDLKLQVAVDSEGKRMTVTAYCEEGTSK